MRKEWKNKQMNERTKQKSQCERDGQRFTLMRKWFACKSSNNHRNYRRAFLSAWKSEHAGNWNRKNFRFLSRYRNGIWRLFLVIKIWKMKRTSYALVLRLIQGAHSTNVSTNYERLNAFFNRNKNWYSALSLNQEKIWFETTFDFRSILLAESEIKRKRLQRRAEKKHKISNC